MMNMKESSSMADTSAVPMQFKEQLDSVYRTYFGIHHALSHDSLDVAKKSVEKFSVALKTVDMSLIDNQAHMAWMKELDILKQSAVKIAQAKTIDEARTAFETLSASMIRVAHQFGTTGKVAVYRFHCPMAFNQKGADWLQGTSEIANPWFGSAMFKCGSLEETISKGTP
jgi:Cu(I)/Ag(I) efflux system membrane fusion protein